MKPFRFLFLCLLLIIALVSKGQYYTSGEAPFSIQWKQIKTDRFQIIFPKDYENQAQIFANKLNYAYSYLGYSQNHSKTKRVSIVLYNTPSFSNGLTAWAPSRIEMYTTPTQTMYGQDWMEQLLIHESRHFIQMDKLNIGLTKVLSLLWGEQGLAATLGLLVPPWYLEGDAVSTETLLTSVGRGRVPSFEQEVRALTLTEGKQTYDRAILGSYKAYIPNHYDWGYQLVTVNRYLAKKNEFSQVMAGIGKNLGWGQPSLHNRGSYKFYDRAIDYLKEKWRVQDEQLFTSEYLPVSINPQQYANYELLASDGVHLYANKSTLDKTADFVLIEQDGSGTEESIIQRGFTAKERFSVAPTGTVVWSEMVPDYRYALRTFSVINSYNPRDAKVKAIRARTRWYAPSIDSSGTRVLLVEADLDNRYYLKIVDVNTGKELWQYESAQKYYFQHPFWMNNDTQVGVIIHGDRGQSLVQIDLTTHQLDTLIPFTFQIISNPIAYRGTIYFTGSWSGIDNIFKYEIESHDLTQVTSSKFGASYPVPIGDNLYYSDYTSKGYQVVKTSLEGLAIPFNQVKNMALNLQDSIVSQELKLLDFSEAGDSTYKVSKYSKWNLFRFHSWGLANVQADNISGVKYGVSALSQNTLGTSLLTIGYNATRSESSEKYYMRYSYRGFWPLIDLDVKGGKLWLENDDIVTKVDDWKTEATLTLPLNFSRGNWSRGFFMYGKLSHLWTSLYDYSSMQYGVQINNLQYTAAKQLQARWGQLFKLSYAHELTSSTVQTSAAILGIQSSFYLPGLVRSHGIKLALNYQKRFNSYLYQNGQLVSYRALSDIVSLPRGYDYLPLGNMLFLSLNYNMPLFYPDWSLGSILYLKRVRANSFADIAQLNYQNSSLGGMRDRVGSYGTELLGDFHFLRYEQAVNLGVRLAWKTNERSLFSEFLIAINF